MNEEQKAWLESVKKFIADAEASGEGYEQIVDGLQLKIDSSPEP